MIERDIKANIVKGYRREERHYRMKTTEDY
jgi:hypothetical protein